MKKLVIALASVCLGFYLVAPLPLEAKNKKHHDKKEKQEPKKEPKEQKTEPKPCGCGKKTS